jgi:hypothetical protein
MPQVQTLQTQTKQGLNMFDRHPVLGQEYLILRDGKCIGKAKYTDDPHHGKCYRGKKHGEYIIYMDVSQAIPVD